MSNLQTIESRIVSIAKLKGLSKNKLLENVNLNKSVFDNMKKGQIPSVDKVETIADYLNCSVDYLLGRTNNSKIQDNETDISITFQNPQLEVLNKIFDDLDPINQAKLLVYADELKNQSAKNK
ncbi:MAG: helix-turn-helix domain-containing protein [Lachnospiraceae bacterium]|nr:helix-turn-helix domain-containing protein [Lachnospiraceae bacterium]